MKKHVSGWWLVLGLWAGYACSGAGCAQEGPYELGAAGAPGTGSAGSGPPGAAGSGSPGAAGSDSTGAAGSDSTGAAGSGSTGAAGSDSTGAAGSDSTGGLGRAAPARRSDSTGAAGSDSTGAAGSDSTGAAGSDSTGAAGSDSTGAAGTTGAAGSGSTTPATFAYTFDTSPQGWELNKYVDTSRKNLAEPASGSAPTLAWDGSTGNPTAGSLKATATFTDWKQFVDAMINISPAKNIPGRVLRVRVKRVSGTFTGGAQIHANTGSSYRYAAGTWTTIASGQWIELTLDLDAAHAADSAFDPTMVVQVGVKFDTGGDGGSSAFGSAVAAVFQSTPSATATDGQVADNEPTPDLGRPELHRPGSMPQTASNRPPGGSVMRSCPVRNALAGQVRGSTARARRRRASGRESPVKIWTCRNGGWNQSRVRSSPDATSITTRPSDVASSAE